SLCVYLLSLTGLWTTDLAKDTILWLFFVGFMTLGKVNKIKDDRDYFKKALKKNFKLSLLSEFLVNFYTFSLAVELIIVPIITLISVTIAFSEKDSKHKPVHKFLTNLLVVFGFVILFYIIFQFAGNPWGIINLPNLRGLLLPLILSILFLPFVYGLSIYMFYETQLVVLKIRLSPELFTYAKRQAFLRFNLNKDGLSRWVKRIHTDTVSKTEIDRLIDHVKEREAIEKNPPKVDPALGWSPFEAGNFLSDEGLKSGYYDCVYEDEWFSSAPSFKLGDKWSDNKISYYVHGTDQVAKRLELILAVFTPQDNLDLHKRFCIIAARLYSKALNELISEKILLAILRSKSITVNKGNVSVSIRKVSWGNSTGGYDVYFTIECRSTSA
ncbi:MAG TPA: hypothetical protein DIT07_02180, partial [Sphingobacteriaceae bacterium]|nr:hypothetical protein [Sphingobacteriaceae bacterium]